MKISVSDTPEQLGKTAAEEAARVINAAIAAKGTARILLSTGASQFQMFENLIQQPVDWTKVEMFHLDEYVGLPITHIASFRKYLTERFVEKVPLKAAYFVSGEGDVKANIAKLTEELRSAPIDLGVIGIGENGHIAFNDPPADFDNDEAYIVVNLDDACKRQQVGEGWFATIDDVPKQAITMTPKQIMKSERIISIVPHKVKADAVRNTVYGELSPMVPATLLKQKADWILYLDKASAELL